MATVCKTCRHYQEIPDDTKFGICFLQFPPWFKRIEKFAESRVVGSLDTCDFWNIDKGNA